MSFRDHMDWLLPSFLVSQVCKRCDMGRTYIFMQDHPVPETAHHGKLNYIKIITRQTPYLVLNQWTKACTSNCRPVKEPLDKGFVEAIKTSLRISPRKWLFTDRKLRPFNSSPNSYGGLAE